MDVLERVQFDALYSFKYSPRPHTPAATYAEQVDKELASKRLQRLQARHKEIQNAQMQKQVGKTLQVLFEELKSEGRVAGRSDDGRLVMVKGSEELLGQIKDVKITFANITQLTGEVL
jgi:tRNA-2-methylthio-N6-dimethylallyladenosine synthase